MQYLSCTSQGHVHGQVKIDIKLPLVPPIGLHTPMVQMIYHSLLASNNIKKPFFSFQSFCRYLTCLCIDGAAGACCSPG